MHFPPQGPLLPTSQTATSGVAGLAREDGDIKRLGNSAGMKWQHYKFWPVTATAAGQSNMLTWSFYQHLQNRSS